MKRRVLIFCGIVISILMSCFILTGCYGNKSTEYDIIKKTKMENFDLLNESAEHNQVVFIGDSIIELFPTYELFANHSQLVYNRGISGDTSDRLLERMDRNCLNIKPNVVYILVGTNDIARNISHDTIIDNIGKTIDKCLIGGVEKVIVSGLYPVNKSIDSRMVGGRTNKEIKELNGKISVLVNNKGAIFSDLTTVLADSDGNFKAEYTYDGLHPNAKGYFAISNAISPLIFEENVA